VARPPFSHCSRFKILVSGNCVSYTGMQDAIKVS
jgi:hypothetical protein